MSVDSESIESQFNLKPHNPSDERVYEFGQFRLDLSKLMLYEDGQAVDLAPKVVETLLALVERSGKLVSKDELMQRLWSDSFVEDGNLTQNIYLLRKTLGLTEDGRPMIETFRRRGYRFNGKLRNPISGAASSEIVQLAGLGRTGYLLAGILAIVVLVAGAWYLISRQNKQANTGSTAQQLDFRRLTPGINTFSPAISPNGKYLTYCLVEQSGHSLWIKELAGQQARRLTSPLFKSCNGPVFSPDSKQIYFVNQENALSRIPISGGTPVQIVRREPNPFAVSPDGGRTVFVRGPELVLANSDGSGETNLSERDGESKWYSALAAPTWSPDGTKILVGGGHIENNRRIAELIEVSVDNGHERVLPTPRWDTISSTAWLRNGGRILIAAREHVAAPLQIWQLSYSEGSVTRLTNDLQSYDHLTVSDDSRSLVTEKTVGACNLWMGSLGDPNSFKQITFDDGDVTGRSGLALTKDNKAIFTASYSGKLDIWEINSDGTGLKQLTANAGDRNIRQQITNDGKYVVFASRAAGTTRRSIWRMDADGSNLVEITKGGQDYPAVSPDRKWVYFTDVSEKISSIWKVPIDGGEISRVTGEYPAFIPSVSPNSTILAFIYGGNDDVADSGHLAILKLDGSEPPKVFDAQPFRGVSQWSLDGKSVIYVQKGTPNLWRQPIDGSPPEQLTNLGLETTWNFAVSFDSERIVVARGNATAEAVLITNFRQ